MLISEGFRPLAEEFARRIYLDDESFEELRRKCPRAFKQVKNVRQVGAFKKEVDRLVEKKRNIVRPYRIVTPLGPVV